MAGSWIEQAEAAMRDDAISGVEIIASQKPILLDAYGRGAVLAPFFAAFMWTAVIFRENSTSGLDPLTLLLRLFALALSARALILCVGFAKRVRTYVHSSRYKLALCDEGLLLRTPQCDVVLRKEDILDIREQGAWQTNRSRRWAEVFLITRPSAGRAYLALLPVFERTPGILAERLMRWRGALQPDALVPAWTTPELPSKFYDLVAAGERPDGVTVLKHGNAWLLGGPYATGLLGIAVLYSFLRLPSGIRDRAGSLAPLLGLVCVALVPALWALITRRQMAPQKGIALVLTPSALLLRTRTGVHCFPWRTISRVEIMAHRRWSLLFGSHELKHVLFQHKDGVFSVPQIDLGAPAEVAAGLCDAYRKASLALAENNS